MSAPLNTDDIIAAYLSGDSKAMHDAMATRNVEIFKQTVDEHVQKLKEKGHPGTNEEIRELVLDEIVGLMNTIMGA